MFNAKKILDQLVQSVQGLSPQNTAAASTQKGGLLGNPAITGALTGVVGGGLLSGLLSGNKKVRNITSKVATVGGSAALGGIALKAFQNWQANKKPQSTGIMGAVTQSLTQQPPQTAQSQQQAALDFDSLPAEKQESHSLAMLTAIIAAAKADGQFDERERKLISEQTAQMNDPQATEWVQQEIKKPLNVDEIAALATSPEMAAEIYLASLIVIDEQNECERKYLNALAEKMNLDEQLRIELEGQIKTGV